MDLTVNIDASQGRSSDGESRLRVESGPRTGPMVINIDKTIILLPYLWRDLPWEQTIGNNNRKNQEAGRSRLCLESVNMVE